ncbi:MAG: low molecular weight protein-tyrosine-phosphatase [Bacteroidota bacterium]
MNILMVCLGNICRSPLAEGILAAKAAAAGLDWTVDSAGTSAYHLGDAPDPRSVAIARQRGLDISQQTARQFRVADFDQFDFIFAMDASNQRDILRLARTDVDRTKVQAILPYVGHPDLQNVPDPYWDDNGFAFVYDLLDSACAILLEKLPTKQ